MTAEPKAKTWWPTKSTVRFSGMNTVHSTVLYTSKPTVTCAISAIGAGGLAE